MNCELNVDKKRYVCTVSQYSWKSDKSYPQSVHNLWISTYVLICRNVNSFVLEPLNFKIKKDTMKETRFETYVIGGILCQKKLKSVLSDMEI